ncbi:MAG: hypothetical protein AB1649_19830 [Chloroflexota bacterium]
MDTFCNWRIKISTKTYRWLLALIVALFALSLMMLNHPVQASAASLTNEVENSCLACHGDLYYLHDTGRYCCVTVHKDRCVDCHEGDAAAMKMEESHIGLIAHPQENNGAKCLECHTVEDTQVRLREFTSTGGFDTVIEASAYSPSAPAVLGFPSRPEVNPLRENLPWVAGGLVLFSLWLLLVLFSPLKP